MKTIELEKQPDGSYEPAKDKVIKPKQLKPIKRQNLQNANPSPFGILDALEMLETIGAQVLQDFDEVARRLR